MSFTGNFTVSFPVSSIDSLDEFPEARKGVRLVVVDHVVFDTFGESIVSLSAECCLTPLNASASCWNLMKYFVAWWCSCMRSPSSSASASPMGS